ncbi:MAG: VOC family protein [Acidimicrobiales bacterium]
MRVGDERSVKNRCHWDVDVAHVDDLVARGATVLAEPSDDCRWTVLADPQGNEFCAFTADG